AGTAIRAAMKDRVPQLVVVLALAGAGAGLLAGRLLAPAGPGAAAADAFAAGSELPATSLPDADGRPQALARWRGKLLLLNCWASWCAPCVAEMPLLDRIQAEWAGSGLQVVGIASVAPEPISAFLAR